MVQLLAVFLLSRKDNRLYKFTSREIMGEQPWLSLRLQTDLFTSGLSIER